MSTGTNIAMDFEMVVKQYLKECDDINFYAAGIYNTNPFAARAIIYTICMKECYCNSKQYTSEQTEELSSFMEKLANDIEGLTAVSEAVNFLKNIKK